MTLDLLATELAVGDRMGVNEGPRLTERQHRFVEAYLVSLNASEAARAAGYVGKRANVAGQAMLRHELVAAAIARQREAEARAARLTSKCVLEGLAAFAYIDVRQLVDQHGLPRPIGSLSADVAQGVEAAYQEGVGLVAKPPSATARVRALELLGRHLGLFAERSAVTVQGLDWRALINTSEPGSDLAEHPGCH